MGRLTTVQIRFINRYLENSGVKYVDIRYEMTDHVATALENMEGDFYDNFKEYMVLHKAQLLASNRKFAQTARNNALKALFANMISRPGILVFGGLFALFALITAYLGEEMVSIVLEAVPVLILIMLLINWSSSNFSKEGRSWSGSDKILGVANLLGYILLTFIKPDKFIDTVPVLIFYYSALMTFMIMAYVSHIKLKRKYRLQYNG